MISGYLAFLIFISVSDKEEPSSSVCSHRLNFRSTWTSYIFTCEVHVCRLILSFHDAVWVNAAAHTMVFALYVQSWTLVMQIVLKTRFINVEYDSNWSENESKSQHLQAWRGRFTSQEKVKEQQKIYVRLLRWFDFDFPASRRSHIFLSVNWIRPWKTDLWITWS